MRAAVSLHGGALSARQMRACCSSSSAQRRPVRCPAVEAPDHAPSTRSSVGAADVGRYAILDLNGFRQVVQEGSAYTCTKDLLQQPTAGRTLLFHSVMALRDGARFMTGKPYVTDAAVEAELVEEFSGPCVAALDARTAVASSAPPPEPTIMARWRVTRIHLTNPAGGNP